MYATINHPTYAFDSIDGRKYLYTHGITFRHLLNICTKNALKRPNGAPIKGKLVFPSQVRDESRI